MGIHILQPHGQGLRSGGYSYNEALSHLLEVRDLGGLMNIGRQELAQKTFPDSSYLLVDSLFLESPLTVEEQGSLKAKGLNIHLLLHLLPFDDPTATAKAKADARAAIESWLPLLSGVIVTGHGAAREFCQHFPDTFTPVVAPPAITPLPRFDGHEGLPLRLLTAGTLCPRKNQHAILHILKKAPPHTWQWDLLGHVDETCPYVQAFRADVHSLQLTDRIRIHGSVSQSSCDTFLSRASVYISASRFESFGIATATALASGVPTLTFRTGDVANWYPQGEGSTYFSVEDLNTFAQHLLHHINSGSVPATSGTVNLPCRSWEDTLGCLIQGLGVLS
jgi:glycosyltransferase involved in cell wall biosynthesis